MGKPIIEVKNLSKLYHLGVISSTTMRESLERWWFKRIGKEELSLKVGSRHLMIEPSDPQAGSEPNTMWALKDVSFTVEKGDVLGVIGRNGAGKSTLLKIISRITEPTEGRVIIRGRHASMLEVGTGFHPELTGRDNVYLNGTILGMRKNEIDRKFDEIVAFAEIDKFIDTPVKRYSSGMYVRLAFAVAAHLDPEVLVVDEVLSVGDAGFQKKALGKMQLLSKDKSKTVLFVSHNLSAVNKLCNKAILLNNGKVEFMGGVGEALNRYSAYGSKATGELCLDRVKDRSSDGKKLVVLSLKIMNELGDVRSEFFNNEGLFVEIRFEVIVAGFGYNVGFELSSERFGSIFTSKFWDNNPEGIDTHKWQEGVYSFRIKVPSYILLQEGFYSVTAACSIPLREVLDIFPGEVRFKIKDFHSHLFKTGEGRNGSIVTTLNWEKF